MCSDIVAECGVWTLITCSVDAAAAVCCGWTLLSAWGAAAGAAAAADADV